MAIIECRKCGQPVSDKADFCSICGTPVGEENVPPENILQTPPPLAREPYRSAPVQPVMNVSPAPAKDAAQQGGKKTSLFLIVALSILVVLLCGVVLYMALSSDDKGNARVEQSRVEVAEVVEETPAPETAAPVTDEPVAVVIEEPEPESVVFNNRTFTVNGVAFNMVAVDGGTFMMGATLEQENAYNDEKPLHTVTVDSYYMGETEVTQELWNAVMGNNTSYFAGNNQFPVESVSYNDCLQFINSLNDILADELPDGCRFRLPTEAEWEFAARGGNASFVAHKYSGGNEIDQVAWYDANSNSSPSEVKKKTPNKLGLYDMSGNVYEWCSDWYSADYYKNSPLKNPQGPASGVQHVIRGGSWDLQSKYSRISLRNYASPGARGYSNGLRLALNAPVNKEGTLESATDGYERELIESILNNISISLTEMCENSGHTYTPPFSTEMNVLNSKARKLATDIMRATGSELFEDWTDVDWNWLESQDWETISYRIINYNKVSETSILVDVQFIDSYSGDMTKKRIEFINMGAALVIDDIWSLGYGSAPGITASSVSHKVSTTRFIQENEGKYDTTEISVLEVVEEDVEPEELELVQVQDASEYADYEEYDNSEILYLEETPEL